MYNNLNVYFIGGINLLPSIKIATLEECFNYCKDKQVLAIDIETTKKYNKYENEGLDPYTSKIVMFQIGDAKKQFIIDHRHQNIEMLLPLLVSPNIIKVGHNIKFEYKHILHAYGVRLVNVYDTQIVEQIIFNGLMLKNSLEQLILRYFKKQVNKSTRLNFLKIGSREFTHTEIFYGAEDILYPILIREKQLNLIKEKNINPCVRLEHKFLLVLGDIEYKGMYFDKEQWLTLYESNLKKLKLIQDQVNEFVIENYSHTEFVSKQLDLFSTKSRCLILWSSSKQVISFFNFLDICPKEVSKQTKKLDYTVNAKVLKASLHTINKNVDSSIKEFINLYITLKETEQSCTTFGKDFFKYINPITQRLHSNFKQILNTGRISSSSPKKVGHYSSDTIIKSDELRETFSHKVMVILSQALHELVKKVQRLMGVLSVVRNTILASDISII